MLPTCECPFYCHLLLGNLRHPGEQRRGQQLDRDGSRPGTSRSRTPQSHGVKAGRWAGLHISQLDKVPQAAGHRSPRRPKDTLILMAQLPVTPVSRTRLHPGANHQGREGKLGIREIHSHLPRQGSDGNCGEQDAQGGPHCSRANSA